MQKQIQRNSTSIVGGKKMDFIVSSTKELPISSREMSQFNIIFTINKPFK
jgi:hypothetical protein